MESTFLPGKMFVYPVPRISPQGRGSYFFTKPDGTEVPAGRTFARNATKVYSFPVSKDGRKIETGLDKKIENPFLNSEYASKHIRGEWIDNKQVRNDEFITLQTYYEVMHNRPPGTYTSERSSFKNMDKELRTNTFFEQYTMTLRDGTNVFQNDMDGQLAMLCAKASKSIASSKNEMNPSLHDFYIGQEHEAAKEKQSRRQKQAKAVKTLEEIKENYTGFTLYQIATVLKVVSGSVNETVVNNKLDDYIWTDDKNLGSRIENFNNVVKGIKTVEGKERLYLRYVFQQALDTNIIYAKNGIYFWPAKKGIENLHNLGTKRAAILRMFYDEMQTYDETAKVENFYGDLIRQLQLKGVKLNEYNKNSDSK